MQPRRTLSADGSWTRPSASNRRTVTWKLPGADETPGETACQKRWRETAEEVSTTRPSASVVPLTARHRSAEACLRFSARGDSAPRTRPASRPE